MPELTKIRSAELYSLRTACGLLLRLEVVSEPTAGELRELDAQITAELNRRPLGGQAVNPISRAPGEPAAPRRGSC